MKDMNKNIVQNNFLKGSYQTKKPPNWWFFYYRIRRFGRDDMNYQSKPTKIVLVERY